ncbi:MAG TPA: LysR substrate-binding domain-containing protein [Polyangiaceae bacterium]|nr:LysR substrate-binding domain-containing protein [Polyangiaceae bacterium]
MEIDELRALSALARAGRFTAAAEALGVSQPTLSRRVQRLERAFGAKLVVRAADGVVLTEAGARALAHVERALASLGSALSEVAELRGEPRGAVSIGALPTVGSYALPPVIASFHRRYPAVRLTVREAFSSVLEGLVANGELDLAVVHYPPHRAELAARRLWSEDYLLAVPPRHRLAGTRRRVALEEILGEPLVVIPGTNVMHAVASLAAAQGRAPVIALETDNLDSVRRMVDAGLGLALVPRLMASDRRGWRAHLVALQEPSVRREIGLVHRGAGYLTAAARALGDAVVAAARARTRTPKGGGAPRLTPGRAETLV